MILSISCVFAEEPVTLKKVVDKLPAVSASQSKPVQRVYVDIRGNKTIDTAFIRQEVGLYDAQSLNPYMINRVVKNLQNLGVFESVKTRVVPFKNGKKLIITVKENKRIGPVVFSGLTSLSKEDLQSVVRLKSGDIMNYRTMRQDMTRIQDYFKEKGYILARVYTVSVPKRNGDPLVFKITEGILESIELDGNDKTRDYVILREFDMKPGEPIRASDLQRDLRRVFNTNFFKKVEPDFLPGKDPKKTILKLDIEEKRTGSFGFGGGYGQQSGLFVYSDINVDNLKGTGRLVQLRGQWGKQVSSYQFKYFDPWLRAPRRSFMFRLWNTSGDIGFSSISSSSFRLEKRKGTDFTFGVPYTEALSGTHRFKLESVDIVDEDRGYNIWSYRYMIAYDTRDIRLNPTDGYYHYVSIEKALPADHLALSFSKYDVSLNKFTPTFKKQVLATRALFGFIEGDIEPTELYYVGGPNTVRGYEDYPDTFAIGRAQAILNVEYRFLFNDTFQALLFVDWGWGSSMSRLDEGKVGKGFGARIMSPLGPIRLDFGFGDSGDMKIHFNVGHVF